MATYPPLPLNVPVSGPLASALAAADSMNGCALQSGCPGLFHILQTALQMNSLQAYRVARVLYKFSTGSSCSSTALWTVWSVFAMRDTSVTVLVLLRHLTLLQPHQPLPHFTIDSLPFFWYKLSLVNRHDRRSRQTQQNERVNSNE